MGRETIATLKREIKQHEKFNDNLRNEIKSRDEMIKVSESVIEEKNKEIEKLKSVINGVVRDKQERNEYKIKILTDENSTLNIRVKYLEELNSMCETLGHVMSNVGMIKNSTGKVLELCKDENGEIDKSIEEPLENIMLNLDKADSAIIRYVAGKVENNIEKNKEKRNYTLHT